MAVPLVRRLGGGAVVNATKPTPPDLELLRYEIDVLDEQIIELLLARFRRLERVAQIKARDGMPGHDPARESVMLAKLERHLAHLGLAPELRFDATEVFAKLIERGRAHVKRRVREIRGARHDGGDGNVDEGAGRPAREDDPS